MSKRGRVRDKWRSKRWYSVIAPQYFGSVKIGSVPTDDPQKLVGRVVESTLYDVTEDFAHQYLKMHFQIANVDGRQALTTFKGHEYSRDYLRSLVRRRTTRVDGVVNVTTKDGYRLRVSACAFSLNRIKTSQEKEIRTLMRRVIEEKAGSLTVDQFVQEAVLGKTASDIYNEAKRVTPLRHVGIRKSKVISRPPISAESETETVAEEAS
ncbi:MAG: 30S ribosomal protein S3ae [Candidatus Bathyarchaeota archaeon]|nr:30S ribosomal protein S3ae [Candidatus Bathyarchaeota archaeon]